MRLTATRIKTFDAAHFLPGHPGKCARMHGHTYRVEFTVERRGGVDPETGMVLDFGDLDAIAQQVLSRFDHHLLNDSFDRPTAEVIAVALAADFNGMLLKGMRVCRLRLWETPDCFVEVDYDA